MKIPDVNVLLYAYDENAAPHKEAREWLEKSLSEAEPTGFPWSVLVGFIRLSTSPVVYPKPLTPVETCHLIDEWLGHPGAGVVEPGPAHANVLCELIDLAGTAGNLASDAHLAAIAIESDSTIASFDADFHRFDRLRFEYLG